VSTPLATMSASTPDIHAAIGERPSETCADRVSAIGNDLIRPADLARVEATLRQRFCPPLRPEVVQRCLLACLTSFADARVKQFIPILVERLANDQLHDLTKRAAAAVGPGLRSPDRHMPRLGRCTPRGGDRPLDC
jgi:hypothetical protein